MCAMDIPYDRNMREDWYGKSGKPQGVIKLLWKDPDEENLLIKIKMWLIFFKDILCYLREAG